MKRKTYHVVANQETFLTDAFDYAQAKERAYHHMQACYGNDYQVLSIKDITDRLPLINSEYTIQGRKV